MADGIRFVRVHGRVIPLRGQGSAPKGVSKRYGAKRENPRVKKLGAIKGAAIGSAVSLATQALVLKKIGIPVIGGILGAAIGMTKYSRKGKGESKAQLAKRVSKNGKSYKAK